NWAPVEENCLPADSLTVTLSSSAVLAKTGAPVTFSVSTGVGARCAEGETYDWYQATGANAYGAVGSTAYPASNKAIAFSPANTYKVKVEASNIYSASAKATSNEVTVYVTNGGGVPSSLYGINYDVLGAPCYDVKRSSTEPESGYTARADSFASGYAKTYIFDYKVVYSDLQVSCEDPHGLVDRIVQPVNKSSSTAPGKEPFTVVFKSGVKSSVPVSGRDTVKLLISYNVGSDTKFAIRYIRVQDAACHCPARIDRLSDRWLTFACHNLGGEDITFATPQPLTRAHHGDWYRFGAAVASLTNVAANDGFSNVSEWENKPIFNTRDYDWPNTSIDANGVGNPCPAGWRLPTEPELIAAISKNPYNISITPENNSLTRYGTWSDSDSDKTNYSAYLKVGDYLYLPAAGQRQSGIGTLNSRGRNGDYWSSSHSNTAGYLFIFDGVSTHEVRNVVRGAGCSVRCVAAE
ncbi:MAG: fibrobacter succinogenes major paralogous domain-containing protein, partial [Dysgonamonadaceae bacterium]|nr:fibrobacter succinogenes major paralogous domain-containing protein [Dysgonamonadaceae bacterium]